MQEIARQQQETMNAINKLKKEQEK